MATKKQVTPTHILSAYVFDGKGGGRKLDGNEIAVELKGENLAWVHLDADNPKTATWLAENVSYLDNLAIEALVADETRPRLEEFDAGALIILRGVNLNEGADPEDMISIRLWVDKTRIISMEKRTLKAVTTIEERIAAGKAPKTSGEFISSLCFGVFADMEGVIQELNDATDELESRQVVGEADVTLRHNIIITRQRAITLKRYITPQRDVITRLRISSQKWVGAKEKRYFLEIYDRAVRYIEDLDMTRERAQVIQDEITNNISEKLGKDMYMLSIIAAIFLPLGFLSSMFGVNLGGIPGGTSPNGFMIFAVATVIVFIIQGIIFKKLKWI